ARAPTPPADGERIAALRMRQTTASADGLPAPLVGARDADVFCTPSALVVGRLAIPLSGVEDAAIERGALHLRWTSGGERLETVLEAPLHDLERLRREIHLTQPNVIEDLLAMVQQ